MKETGNSNEDKFRERMYDGDKITERYLTREEVLRLDPHDVDFHWDRAFGKVFIRRPDGKHIEHSLTLPGVGWVSEDLLMAQMRRPGQLLTPVLLVAITKLATFEENYRISQRMSRLRAVFGENADSEWFFRSSRDPFSVGWNIERTWRIIEAVVASGDENDGRKGE